MANVAPVPATPDRLGGELARVPGHRAAVTRPSLEGPLVDGRPRRYGPRMATALGRVFRRSHLGTEADRATFRTLHEASLASPALREGLTGASAERSIRHLRALLGAPAVALT